MSNIKIMFIGINKFINCSISRIVKKDPIGFVEMVIKIVFVFEFIALIMLLTSILLFESFIITGMDRNAKVYVL